MLIFKIVFHRSPYLKEKKHNLGQFYILCDRGSPQLFYIMCLLYIMNHHNAWIFYFSYGLGIDRMCTFALGFVISSSCLPFARIFSFHWLPSVPCTGNQSVWRNAKWWPGQLQSELCRDTGLIMHDWIPTSHNSLLVLFLSLSCVSSLSCQDIKWLQSAACCFPYLWAKCSIISHFRLLGLHNEAHIKSKVILSGVSTMEYATEWYSTGTECCTVLGGKTHNLNHPVIRIAHTLLLVYYRILGRFIYIHKQQEFKELNWAEIESLQLWDS